MILEIIAVFLMSLGCIIMFSAALALNRFPDVYMRIHASAKASTGGTLALLGGLLIVSGLDEVSGKILIIIMLIIFTGPILSHAIARAAHVKMGLSVETPFQDLEEEEEDIKEGEQN